LLGVFGLREQASGVAKPCLSMWDAHGEYTTVVVFIEFVVGISVLFAVENVVFEGDGAEELADESLVLCS